MSNYTSQAWNIKPKMSSVQEKVMHVAILSVMIPHALYASRHEQIIQLSCCNLRHKRPICKKNLLYLFTYRRSTGIIFPTESPSDPCCSSEPGSETLVILDVATGRSMLQSLLPSTTTTGVFPAPGEPHSRVPPCAIFRDKQISSLPLAALNSLDRGSQAASGLQTVKRMYDIKQIVAYTVIKEYLMHCDWPSSCFSNGHSDRLLYMCMRQ